MHESKSEERLWSAFDRLTELSATTPAGGTLQGSGLLALDPDEGFPLAVDVSLRNGEVVDTALASATADAASSVDCPVSR